MLLVFAVAFSLRSALLFSWMVPREWVVPETRSEIGRVAQSIAQTGRFADPYAVPTGATAHPPPLFTGFLGLLYHILGMTLAAGYVRGLFGIVSYSMVAALIPWVASRMGLKPRAGLIAGLGSALFPQDLVAEVIAWTAAEALGAVALALLMGNVVGRWESNRGSTLSAAGLGVGWGVSFHLVPALLLVMLGCVVFELWWRGWRSSRGSVVAILLAALLVCLPWMFRNWVALNGAVFVRSNFGLELRLGNHEGATFDMESLSGRKGAAFRHPVSNTSEALLVAEMGELEYMRRARNEALSWIFRNPVPFIKLTAARAFCFWFGSPARPAGFLRGTLITVLAVFGAFRLFPSLTTPQKAGILIPLLAFPGVYFVVAFMERYTVPVSWIPLMLAGAAFGSPSSEEKSAGRERT